MILERRLGHVKPSIEEKFNRMSKTRVLRLVVMVISVVLLVVVDFSVVEVEQQLLSKNKAGVVLVFILPVS